MHDSGLLPQTLLQHFAGAKKERRPVAATEDSPTDELRETSPERRATTTARIATHHGDEKRKAPVCTPGGQEARHWRNPSIVAAESWSAIVCSSSASGRGLE